MATHQTGVCLTRRVQRYCIAFFLVTYIAFSVLIFSSRCKRLKTLADGIKNVPAVQNNNAVMPDNGANMNVPSNRVGSKNMEPIEQLRGSDYKDLATKSLDQPLSYIPGAPDASTDDVVPYLDKQFEQSYLKIPDGSVAMDKSIVIVTPIRNVEKFLGSFVESIGRLTYNHSLMSVYFGEDGSTDHTYSLAQNLSKTLVHRYKFKDAMAFQFVDFSGGVHGAIEYKHAQHRQLSRRAHLAEARNRLLEHALKATGHVSHVLWIDGDVMTIPDDLVQQLLSANTDVVVPACLFMEGNNKRVYDKNTWRETPASLKYLDTLGKDELMLEGYRPSLRLFLSHLKAEGRVVPLDGVGGCVLFIDAKCHRKGLKFPVEVYKHHIETEGLSKLATDMGYTVVGLPWLEVFHW